MSGKQAVLSLVFSHSFILLMFLYLNASNDFSFSCCLYLTGKAMSSELFILLVKAHTPITINPELCQLWL
jgi:hypothetical protein